MEEDGHAPSAYFPMQFSHYGILWALVRFGLSPLCQHDV